jgi:hypothetical protein
VRWPHAHSRLALKTRRWRSRFGISARRVAVRTHVPWYWRASGVLLLLLMAIVLADWVYDAGRRFAGFDRSESEQERATLVAKSSAMERELARLRSLADASESKLQIELTAQEQLARQVKALEQENVRLKEDLSVFENLASAEGQEGSVYINRLRLEPEAVDRYRYRMLLAVQGGKKTGEFIGNMQLALSLQQDGKNVMMVLPTPDDPTAKNYAISFKHFRRVEGTFKIPTGARLKGVEVRLFQQGALKASKNLSL